jgi:hypothetical protein
MATSYTLYTLQPTVAPRLPAAPTQYDARFIEQYSNILRLYFNQLDNLLAAILSSTGGDYLAFPYGAFHQNGHTTLSANMTNNSTTPIQVADTSGFPSSGWLLIENEIVSYTTKTATTFDGTITRGVFGTTNVAHTAGVAITEAQGTGSPTTIGKVLFNNTDYTNGVAVNAADQTQVVFSKPGIYNLQFSAQLLNFTTSDDNVTIWFRVNGTDVAASASIEEVNAKHGTAPGARICTVNLYQQFAVNDYVQLAWTSDSGNSVLASFPAGTSPVHPISPGVIFTCQFVSAPPT